MGELSLLIHLKKRSIRGRRSQRSLFKVIQVWQTRAKVSSEARFGGELLGIRVSLGTAQSAGVPAGLQGPRGRRVRGLPTLGLHEAPGFRGGLRRVVEVCWGLVGGGRGGGGEMKKLPQRPQRLRQNTLITDYRHLFSCLKYMLHVIYTADIFIKYT